MIGRGVIGRTLTTGTFFALLAMGPFSAAFFDPVKTRASVPRPAPTDAQWRNGEATRAIETWLQERSWWNYQLRGLYTETRFRLGQLEDDQVVFRPDGWMFLQRDLSPDGELFKATTAIRRGHLRTVASLAQQANVQVIVALVPDTATIYPDKAYPDGQLPAAKTLMYEGLLAECRAEALTAIDLRPALRRARSEADRDDTTVYHLRDIHWTRRGATAAATEIAGTLRNLGIVPATRASAAALVEIRSLPMVPQMVHMLGMRTITPGNEWSDNALVRELQERWDYATVRIDAPAAPAARVALVGTSFSKRRLDDALTLELGTALDTSGIQPGGGPLANIYQTLRRVIAGELDTKVVIWEFAELQGLQPFWLRQDWPGQLPTGQADGK